jgi:hypothetical protein
MTDQELEKWQETLLETAKSILLEQNRVFTQVFVLTRMMNVPETYKKKMMDLKTMRWAAELDDGSTPNAYVMLMFEVHYEDPEQLMAMITDMTPEPEKAKAILPVLISKGKELGVQNPERHVVNALKRMWGFGHDKDVVAAFIANMVHDVEAEAWAKVDEAWTRHMEPEEGETPEEARKRVPESLENDNLAMEALMVSLETKTLTKLITLPFFRTERDTGRVTDFGKMNVMTDDGKGPHRLTGRFVGFLREDRR